jgi:hypothetical protein
LLERLAATEEMFKTPVSTIRDVAELTDASPNLIARILGEMRGPGEFEKLVRRVEVLEGRHDSDQKILKIEPMQETDSEKLFAFFAFSIALLIIIVIVFISQVSHLVTGSPWK